MNTYKELSYELLLSKYEDLTVEEQILFDAGWEKIQKEYKSLEDSEHSCATCLYLDSDDLCDEYLFFSCSAPLPAWRGVASEDDIARENGFLHAVMNCDAQCNCEAFKRKAKSL